MMMKVDRNKGICTDFGKNVLNVCRDNHYDLPLGDPAMNLPPHNLQDLPCLSLVLLRLEFIICLIESACTSPPLPNLDTILCKKIEAFSDIHVVLEAILFEEFPPLREFTYNVQIIWRDIYVELDI